LPKPLRNWGFWVIMVRQAHHAERSRGIAVTNSQVGAFNSMEVKRQLFAGRRVSDAIRGRSERSRT